MRALATVGGIVLFGAVLFWMTLRQGGTECEVCMQSGAQVYCASVVAASPEDAVAQARNKACGVLTQGMTEELQCGRSDPQSVSCRDR